MKATLECIRIYPLKSAAPVTLDAASVEARGLVGDRRWMIVDADGKFVTARKHPRLVLIRARIDGDGLMLEAPGMPSLTVTADAQAERFATAIWKDRVMAMTAAAAADRWISEYLGVAARFVHIDSGVTRAVNPAYARPGDEVGFADGFPLLLISQASLDGLNERLAQTVPMLRFRPNVVVAGTAAHAEDDWHSVRIGEVRFDVVKSCTRCVLTTVDPATGCFDAQGEPLRTLTRYRRSEKGVLFGQNLIPRGIGRIRQGDTVEVIA